MPDNDQKKPSGERRRFLSRYPATRSNILTLLIATAIVALGILLPPLLYPQMDTYSDQVVVLEDDSLSRVYDEPVSLYPWNLYTPEACRSLSTDERSLLIQRGVPEFLLATLVDRGLELPTGADGMPDKTAYLETIISNFRYLNVEGENHSGCFVLVDVDVNGDGVADMRSAVEQNGNIIYALWKPEWDTVTLTADDYPAAQPADTTGGAGAPQGSAAGATTGEGGSTAGDEGGTGTTDAGVADAGVTNGAGNGEQTADVPAGPSLPETTPVAEDRKIWSFAYATMHEAQTYQQPALAAAFSLIDQSYQYEYGYSFRLLLLSESGGTAEAFNTESQNTAQNGSAGGSNSSGEALEEAALFPLKPTPFTDGDNTLYIYDLPNNSNVRIIIYVDRITQNCVGFNFFSL